MFPPVFLHDLTEEGKCFLLAEAQKGLKPSDAILRALEREAFRRGFRLPDVSTARLSVPCSKGQLFDSKKSA